MDAHTLRGRLNYNPETGVFTWRKRMSSRAPEGGVAGSINTRGYVVINQDGRPILAHRLAWLWMNGEYPEFIDHINGLKSDNRWVNLRNVTSQGNNLNRNYHREGAIEPGVIWHETKTAAGWRVRLRADSVSIDRLFSVSKHGFLPGYMLAVQTVREALS